MDDCVVVVSGRCTPAAERQSAGARKHNRKKGGARGSIVQGGRNVKIPTRKEGSTNTGWGKGERHSEHLVQLIYHVSEEAVQRSTQVHGLEFD